MSWFWVSTQIKLILPRIWKLMWTAYKSQVMLANIFLLYKSLRTTGSMNENFGFQTAKGLLLIVVGALLPHYRTFSISWKNDLQPCQLGNMRQHSVCSLRREQRTKQSFSSENHSISSLLCNITFLISLSLKSKQLSPDCVVS